MNAQKADIKKLEDRLIAMDAKLTHLVTMEAVQEYRIKQLESNQKGAVKFSMAALLGSFSIIVKYVVDKIGSL